MLNSQVQYDDLVKKLLDNPQGTKITLEVLRKHADQSLAVNNVDRDETFRQLGSGRAILTCESLLDRYLYSYGRMTENQWNWIFTFLDGYLAEPESLQVVDYGCGQGLSAFKVAQMLSDVWSEEEVRNNVAITLIEKSTVALARASQLAKLFFEGSLVKPLECCVNELRTDDILSDVADRYLHVFSNVLDIEEVKHFHLLEKILRISGHHTIVAVSNDREIWGGTPKLRSVYRIFEKKTGPESIIKELASVEVVPEQVRSINFAFSTSSKYWRCYAFAASWRRHNEDNKAMDLFDDLPGMNNITFSNNAGVSVSTLPSGGGQLISVPNGEILYYDKFFGRQASDDYTSVLGKYPADGNAFINWKQDHIRMYGKEIPLPRLTAWYGDAGRSYTYSGITSQPNEWNDTLLRIKQSVEEVALTTFNSVLLNWYRDGNDHLSWHADDEDELGQCPTIASVSFGAARDFLLRRNDDHKFQVGILLQHGSLLIMRGQLQHFWQHSVPKRKRVEAGRFNLTFRHIG